MRRALCVPFLLLLVVTTDARAQRAAPGGIEVRGRVLATGGAPLEGAEVALLPADDVLERGERRLDGKPEPAAAATATSAADGSFAITAPSAGFWTLRVGAARHVPRQLELAPLVEERQLEAVALVPDRPLEVEVLDAAGRPVAAAWVAAEPATRTGGPLAFFEEGWGAAARFARRGEGGPVRLPRGEGERLSVRAFAPATAGTPATPATSAIGEAEATVAPGSKSVTLRLPPASPPRTIEVRDAAGKPAAGVLVIAGKGSWPLGRTGADGRLRAALPVAEGEEVHALASGARRGAARLRPAAAGEAPDGGDRPAAVITLPAAGALAGRVLDAERREPIAGALIWRAGDLGGAVRTDGAGSYRLAATAAGQSALNAAAPGYRRATERMGVDAGGEGRGPTFALQPAARLRGRVLDADTKTPLSGVEVTVREAPAGPGVFRFQGMEGLPVARTAADGRFELRGLATGTPYELRLLHTGYASRTAPVPPIAAGAPPPPPLELTLDRGRRAVGKVLDLDERPIAGATVRLRDAEEGRGDRMMTLLDEPEAAPIEASTDARGTFSLTGFPAGRYDLEARAPGFAPREVPGLEVPGGRGEHDLGTVLLQPGAAVEGRVSDPQGNPIGEAEVRITPSGGRGALFTLMFRRGDEPDAWSDADGWFRVPDLVPGRPVELVVSRKGYAGAHLPQVAPPGDPLAVTLQPSLRIAGRVAGARGEPMAGAQLFLSAERQRGGMVSMRSAGHAVSDQDGRFVFADVEPGTLRLAASAPGRQSAELGGIVAEPGKDVEGLELVLAPGAAVEGRVTEASGRPAAGVYVSLVEDSPSLASRMSASVMADGDGWYRLDGLAPGLRSIAAQDDQGRRAAGEVEVREGVNGRLDLRFAGGVEVSGRVLDAEGTPVPAARVMLAASPGAGWGRHNVSTGADGGFVLGDVEDGDDYRLLVTKEGYAQGESAPFKVAGAPVSGLEIRLEAGGAIAGLVRGLEPDVLVRVEVRGNRFGGGPFQSRASRVDYEGRYRLPALGAGEWRVVAEVPGSGRRAEGRVTLAPGTAEVALDLDFDTGLTLSGRVTRGGAPLPGALVEVRGKDVADSGSADSDREGAFRITGLEPGTYDVTVQAGAARITEEVALQGDREVQLELETSAVAGRVIEAGERTPVAGAVVRVEPPEGTVESRFFFSRYSGSHTDSQGRFRLSEVAAGRWRLRVERDGYGAAEQTLDVVAGTDVDDLEIALVPTTGLVIEVLRATGGAPGSVMVTVADAAGQVVDTGYRETGEGGRVRLSTVPAGSYEVWASSPGLAVGRAAAVVPGPAVRLVLQPAAVLEVRVPDLDGQAALATAVLRGAEGTPFRRPSWGGTIETETKMSGGRARWNDLPPGTWTVEVRAADGATWTGTASLAPGQTFELVLE